MAEAAPALFDSLAAACTAANHAGAGPVRLRSAPGAARYLGPSYLNTIVARLRETTPVEAAIDCGGDAGVVIRALAADWRDIIFSGDPELGAKLNSLAAAAGARLSVEGPQHSDERRISKHEKGQRDESDA